MIDVAGTAARQLTSGTLHVERHPAPDGSKVAFMGQPTPLRPDSFRWSSSWWTGGAPQALVARKGPDASPAWSPDGKWIAFVSQDGRDGVVHEQLRLRRRRVRRRPRNLTPGFDEEIGGSLLWTPDSTALVFSA